MNITAVILVTTRQYLLAIMSFVLEVSRGIEVHVLHHLGTDTYGSHGEVPFADQALERKVRLNPVESIDGKLRFLDHSPFSPGQVELTLIVEASDGREIPLKLGPTDV